MKLDFNTAVFVGVDFFTGWAGDNSGLAAFHARAGIVLGWVVMALIGNGRDAGLKILGVATLVEIGVVYAVIAGIGDEVALAAFIFKGVSAAEAGTLTGK